LSDLSAGFWQVPLAGAAEIAVTDQLDEPLQVAQQLGAQRTFNITHADSNGGRVAAFENRFDVAIEAAGALLALSVCISSVVPGAELCN
jgi:L-idonate 5-dehydrogenase